MTKYYLEILEEETTTNSIQPKEIFRKYVVDETAAETEYEKQKDVFTGKPLFVEMNHDIDATKNKPCVVKEFKDGKVVNDEKDGAVIEK